MFSTRVDHAFDTLSIQSFCEKNNVPAGRLFQAAWAVVVSTYLDTEEVNWRCQTTDGAVTTIASYRGRVEGSETFMQVLDTLEKIERDESSAVKPASKQSRHGAWQALLNDACLSIGTRKENNKCRPSKAAQEVLCEMPFCFSSSGSMLTGFGEGRDPYTYIV